MKIERIDGLPFGRAYKVFDEKEVHFLPSVTTILKLNKEDWLIELEEQIGSLKFQELTERGGRRGSVMHRYIEHFLDYFYKDNDPEKALLYAQQEIKVDPEFDGWEGKYDRELKIGRNLFYNFYHQNFWEGVKELLHTEIFLYTFFKKGWAGTADFIFRDEFKDIIVKDWKSSSYIKEEDKLHNYKMQISAYMFKFADMFGEIPKRGIIEISNEANNVIQRIIVENTEFKKYLRDFLDFREEFEKGKDWKEFLEKMKQSQEQAL